MRGRMMAVMAVVALSVAGCGGGDDDGAPAATRAGLWVGRSGLQELTLLDADGEVQAAVDLCCTPRALAVTEDDVWVSTDTGKVLRVDRERHAVAAEIDVGGSAGARSARTRHR